MYDFQVEVRQLDTNLQPYLHPGFYFVNIGANDGVIADPIYPFIDKYGWHGVAVEPVPYVFDRLRRNYAHLEGVAFENAAVSNRPETFWFIAEGSGTIDFIANSMGSLDRDRVLETIKANRFLPAMASPIPPVPDGLPGPVGQSDDHDGPLISDDLEDYLTGVEVACYTFDELMARQGREQVDFINIDVEGRDDEVLAMIDLDRYRPTVLCVETVGLPDAAAASMREQLRSHGFELRQHFTIFSEIWFRTT